MSQPVKRQAWYIHEDGKTHGPVSARELLYLVEIERLDPDALVWRPGFSEWKPAHEVEGLYKPPPLPVAPGAKPSRPGPRPPSSDYVRVIAPPRGTEMGQAESDPSPHRGPVRPHRATNGRAEREQVDIEASETDDRDGPGFPKTSPTEPGPRSSGSTAQDFLASAGAGMQLRQITQHVSDADSTDDVPADADELVARRQGSADEDDLTLEVNEPSPPGDREDSEDADDITAGLSDEDTGNETPEHPSPPPFEDEPAAGNGRTDDDAPPSGRNGLAESILALEDANDELTEGLEGDAEEKLGVLDQLVSRMESLEGNLRDEIAKNQELNERIELLKKGEPSPEDDDAEFETAEAPATEPEPDETAVPEPVEPSNRNGSPAGPQITKPDNAVVVDPEDTVASRQDAEREDLKPEDLSPEPAEPELEISIEVDDDYDESYSENGSTGSADWLNVAAENDPSGRSYLHRHWAGELSLGRSLWLNSAPLLLVLIALPFVLNLINFGNDQFRFIAAAVLFILSLPFLVWMVIGVWRAAEHHRAWRGGIMWPSLAQTWVLLSLVIFVGTYAGVFLPDRIAEILLMHLDLDGNKVERSVATMPDVSREPAVAPEPAPVVVPLPVDTATETQPPPAQEELPVIQADVASEPPPADDGAARIQALESQVADLRKKTQGALVQVIAFNASKIPTNVGMGFYFEEDQVVTSFSTVRDAQALSLQNVGGKDISFAARVKAYSESLDIAVIETTRKATPITIADADALTIGDPVLVLGNPRWESSATSLSKLNGMETVDGATAYLASAVVSPGSRGGPAFDADGKLVGLARFWVRSDGPRTAIMPAGLIRKVAALDMSKVPPPAPADAGTGLRSTLRLTSYVKAPGAETEEISLRNETGHSLENIFFAVLYKGKGGNILYGRSLQMPGPVPPGAEQSMTANVPDLLKNFASEGAENAKATMSVEIIPLDYMPQDISG